MRYFILITIIVLIMLSVGCSNKINNYCDINTNTVTNLKRYDRGSINGGYDENGDGKVDHIEAFSSWDFSQLERVLHSGIEYHEYYWVNIDTCYSFRVTPLKFKEDRNQPVFYQTCRNFNYSVYSPNKELIGIDSGKGCRSFVDHSWEIL